MTILRTNYPRLFRELRRPVGFFGGIGDQTLFFAKAIAGVPHALVHFRKEVIRLIAEISMGAGTLAMIGGTVAIVGFLTRGRGVSIHREDCPSMQHLAARHPERVLPVEWGRRGGQSYQVDVLVRGIDRKWLLKDLSNVIGVANAYVLGVNSRVDPDTSKAELRFSLRVNDFQQLGELLGKMAAVPGVSDVRRTP